MIAIITACGNNFTSLQIALQRLGAESNVTNEKKKIQTASHVLLAGVGHAKNHMNLLAKAGLIEVISKLTQPVLGICLGMQMLYEHSEEGEINCLGILPGHVTRLGKDKKTILPHIGWNTVDYVGKSNQKNYAYYAHSYAAPINEYTLAQTDYSRPFSAIVRYENFTGMQFHPEKSANFGENKLKQFLIERK